MSSGNEFLDMYIYETNTLLEQLETIVLEAEKVDTFSQENVNEIFRIMHTVKGSSAMMEFDTLATVAHRIEDLFFIVRENTMSVVSEDDRPALFDLVFQSIDYFRGEVEKLENDEPLDKDIDSFLSNINTLIAKIKGEEVPAAPAAPASPAPAPAAEAPAEPAPAAPAGGAFPYSLRVSFEEGCGMESLRAFMLVTSVLELCAEEDFTYDPANVETDSTTSEAIIERGFLMNFKTAEDREKAISVVRSAGSVQDYQSLDLPAEPAAPAPAAVEDPQPAAAPAAEEPHPAAAPAQPDTASGAGSAGEDGEAYFLRQAEGAVRRGFQEAVSAGAEFPQIQKKAGLHPAGGCAEGDAQLLPGRQGGLEDGGRVDLPARSHKGKDSICLVVLGHAEEVFTGGGGYSPPGIRIQLPGLLQEPAAEGVLLPPHRRKFHQTQRPRGITICRARISGMPRRKERWRVLWRQTLIPAKAPALPPRAARRNRVFSGTRRVDGWASFRLAFHLSRPNAKKAARLMKTSQQASRLQGEPAAAQRKSLWASGT